MDPFGVRRAPQDAHNVSGFPAKRMEARLVLRGTGKQKTPTLLGLDGIKTVTRYPPRRHIQIHPTPNLLPARDRRIRQSSVLRRGFGSYLFSFRGQEIPYTEDCDHDFSRLCDWFCRAIHLRTLGAACRRLGPGGQWTQPRLSLHNSKKSAVLIREIGPTVIDRRGG